MGQTRVDLLHLLEDLRDAYPGGLEETIVAETVANALDSGAGDVAFTADTAERTLTIVDDGEGISFREKVQVLEELDEVARAFTKDRSAANAAVEDLNGDEGIG